MSHEGEIGRRAAFRATTTSSMEKVGKAMVFDTEVGKDALLADERGTTNTLASGTDSYIGIGCMGYTDCWDQRRGSGTSA